MLEIASMPSSQVPTSSTICTTVTDFSSDPLMSCQVAMNSAGSAYSSAKARAAFGSDSRRLAA